MAYGNLAELLLLQLQIVNLVFNLVSLNEKYYTKLPSAQCILSKLGIRVLHARTVD